MTITQLLQAIKKAADTKDIEALAKLSQAIEDMLMSRQDKDALIAIVDMTLNFIEELAGAFWTH